MPTQGCHGVFPADALCNQEVTTTGLQCKRYRYSDVRKAAASKHRRLTREGRPHKHVW